MKPDRDLRAAAIALMGTVAAVGVVRGLMPRPAEAAPAVLVRPQSTSGDPAEPPGTLHLNSRGRPAAPPAGDPARWPAWPGIDPAAEPVKSAAATDPRG